MRSLLFSLDVKSVTMSVTLDLRPEVEEHIKAEANARGLSVEDYILDVLERETSDDESNFARTASAEEWKKSFLEWVHTPRPAHPPLSDEAISRESIYREREDAQL